MENWETERIVSITEKAKLNTEAGNIGIVLNVESVDNANAYEGTAYVYLPFGEGEKVEVCTCVGDTLEKAKEELIYNLFVSWGDDLALLGSKLGYSVDLSIKKG